MHDRRRRPRLIAAAFASVFVLASVAPASAGATVRDTSRGARWHAVTVDLSPGASWSATVRARVTGTIGAVVCAGFVRDAAGDASAGGGMHWQSRRDTHAFASARLLTMERTSAGGEVPLRRGTKEYRCATDAPHQGPRAIRSFLFFIASDATIVSSSILFEVRGPATLLASSKGMRSSALREWEFDSDWYARAGADRRCSALTQARGRRSIRFDRAAVAIFSAGGVAPASPFMSGAPGQEITAVLSVTGPDRLTGTHANGTSFVTNAISFVGAPGDYRFGIEALIAPQCTTGPVGKDPYVVLATVDADFPACTTRGARVLARPRSGPMRCVVP